MAEIRRGGTDPSAITETTREIVANTVTLVPIYQAAIRVLSAGFRLGAAILGISVLVALLRQESLKRSAESYGDLIPSILNGRASGIASLAIIVLVATPIVTVLTIAMGFFRIGDRRFGFLSLIVLGVLATSVTISLFR